MPEEAVRLTQAASRSMPTAARLLSKAVRSWAERQEAERAAWSAAKLAAGRPQDLADVDALNRAKRQNEAGRELERGKAAAKPPAKP